MHAFSAWRIIAWRADLNIEVLQPILGSTETPWTAMHARPDFTRLLDEAGAHGRAANELAFRLTYDELRRLARTRMRHERAGHTLGATGLVHQVYLKLVDQTRITWKGRQHFLYVAAGAMRRLLINHARDRKAQKRGGGAPHLAIDDAVGLPHRDPDDALIALDAALDELAAFDDRKRRVVELRYFAGLTEDEIAEALGISRATVQRDWYAARAWLFDRLNDEP